MQPGISNIGLPPSMKPTVEKKIKPKKKKSVKKKVEKKQSNLTLKELETQRLETEEKIAKLKEAENKNCNKCLSMKDKPKLFKDDHSISMELYCYTHNVFLTNDIACEDFSDGLEPEKETPKEVPATIPCATKIPLTPEVPVTPEEKKVENNPEEIVMGGDPPQDLIQETLNKNILKPKKKRSIIGIIFTSGFLLCSGALFAGGFIPILDAPIISQSLKYLRYPALVVFLILVIILVKLIRGKRK